MVLLLLTDGSLLEVPQVKDVAHKPGSLVCYDPNHAFVASFDASKVLGYKLNPYVAEAMKDGTESLDPDDNGGRRRILV